MAFEIVVVSGHVQRSSDVVALELPFVVQLQVSIPPATAQSVQLLE